MKGNKTIKRLNQRDIKFLEMIARVGHVPIKKDDLDYDIDVSQNRLHTYVNMDWIEKVQDKDKQYYRATAEGRKKIEDITSIKPYYSNSPTHDESLFTRYIGLSKEEQDSWKTEGELREEYFEYITELEIEGCYKQASNLREHYDNGDISVPDCAYVSTEIGTYIAVEIITNHYSQEMIEAKEEFCEVMQIECELERAD